MEKNYLKFLKHNISAAYILNRSIDIFMGDKKVVGHHQIQFRRKNPKQFKYVTNSLGLRLNSIQNRTIISEIKWANKNDKHRMKEFDNENKKLIK